MRYWLTSFTLTLCLFGVGVSQETKKTGKDSGKESKSKDPAKDPPVPEFKVPKDVGGKTFEQWRNEIKKNLDPSQREVAMKMILMFGPEKSYDAVDDIIVQLNKHKNAPVDLSVRVNGIMALSTIFKSMKEPDAKKDKEANAVYRKRLKDALAVYRMFLKDDQVVMRLQTVKGLPYLGPIAREAEGEVLKLVKDIHTWEVRKEAIPVLVMLTMATENADRSRAITELRIRAKDSSQFVRGTALQGLAVLSHPVVPPELFKALEDPSNQVRLTSLQTLGAMAPKMSAGDKKLSISKLNAHLTFEKDAGLNIWTHATIMTIVGKMTKEDMTAIVNKVRHADPSVRIQALQMICMAGQEAKTLALPTVLSAFHDPETSVGVAAINTMFCLHAFEVVPMLKELKEDKKQKEELRNAATLAIVQLEVLEKHLKEVRDKKDKGGKKTAR